MNITTTAPGTWMLAFSEGTGSYMVATAPDGDWLSLAAPIHQHVMDSNARATWSVQDIADMLCQGHPIPIGRIRRSIYDDDDDCESWWHSAITVKTGLTLYAGERAAEDAGAAVIWTEADEYCGAICHETLDDELLPDGRSWVAAFTPKEAS